MPAGIVYEGDVRTGGSELGVGNGPELFEGIIFHVLQRVPLRQTVIQQILSNGGKDTPIEKNADIVIADSAKRNNPKDSVCWKFITSSLKKGELQDEADYPANKDSRRASKGAGVSGASSGAALKSVQPNRTGRTPFTFEDDRILMEFCMRMERRGGQMKGNVVFKEFAEQHPRHTFQSWRDRWVKHLHDRPRPTLDEEEDEEEEEEKGPKPSRTREKASRTPSRPVQKPIGIQAVRSSTSKPKKSGSSKTVVRPSSATPVREQDSDAEVRRKQPYLQKSIGGTNFTDEEVQLLHDDYDAILNVDDDRIIDAWIAWAEEYPNHNPQEWRNYFDKKIRGKQRLANEAKIQEPPPSRSSISSPPKDKGKGKANEVIIKPASAQEVKDSQGSSNRTIESPENAKTSTQSTSKEEDQLKEETFKANLSIVAKLLLPQLYDDGIEYNPTICDSRLSLYEIWRTITMDPFKGVIDTNERGEWEGVAQRLGFDKSDRLKAGHELRKCCNTLLLSFEESLETVCDVTDSQAEEMVDDQLQQTAIEAAERYRNAPQHEESEEEGGDDLGAPQSSPFVTVSTKRASPDSVTPLSKRRKLNKGKGRNKEVSEIPSTPEAVLNGSFQKMSSIGLSSIKSSLRPSPLKQVNFGRKNLSEVEEKVLAANNEAPEDEEESLFLPRSPPPQAEKRASSPKRRMSDPKTQDFHFYDEPPEDDEPQLEEDVEDNEAENQPEPSPSPVRTRKIPIHSNSNSNNQSSVSTKPSQAGSSTQSQTTSQKQQTLEDFINSCIALGYNSVIAWTACGATSFVVGPTAMRVMESLTQEEGIPGDIKGVWTEEDDEALKGYLADKKSKKRKKQYEEVVFKHGKACIKERKKFYKNFEE